MIEVDCRKCKNCNGNGCIAYETENPNIAVEKCAKDGFKNYIKRIETRLGFLKRGDYFVFEGIKYKVIKLLENTNGYVACLDEENKKIKKLHIDIDIEVIS